MPEIYNQQVLEHVQERRQHWNLVFNDVSELIRSGDKYLAAEKDALVTRVKAAVNNTRLTADWQGNNEPEQDEEAS